jgi:hypothetical protein
MGTGRGFVVASGIFAVQACGMARDEAPPPKGPKGCEEVAAWGGSLQAAAPQACAGFPPELQPPCSTNDTFVDAACAFYEHWFSLQYAPDSFPSPPVRVVLLPRTQVCGGSGDGAGGAGSTPLTPLTLEVEISPPSAFERQGDDFVLLERSAKWSVKMPFSRNLDHPEYLRAFDPQAPYDDAYMEGTLAFVSEGKVVEVQRLLIEPQYPCFVD